MFEIPKILYLCIMKFNAYGVKVLTSTALGMTQEKKFCKADPLERAETKLTLEEQQDQAIALCNGGRY